MNSTAQKSCFACLPKTERGKPMVLGGDPKGKTFLYVNGTSVIIRDLENPSDSDVFTEHSYATTCAKYAPSGFYISSGDVSGKIKIWDTTQKEHLTKYEYQPISGAIKDISWSPDSKRIAVGGDGREKYAHCIMWDTGTSVGDMVGHSRAVNSVDYRPERPFRLITGSEDFSTNLYEGPPFKHSKTLRENDNFVNVVRYAPKGERFATGAASGKLCFYEGKTAELEKEIASAHKGGIYSLCFNSDGTKLLTVSADKTAKVWDVSEGTVISEFTFGKKVEDMQVGCLWLGNYLLTVSLSGHINYLDANDPTQISRILKGHNKPITAMCVSEDKTTIFTGSSDGHLNFWDADSGHCDEFSATGHSNQIQDMVTNGDELVTVGMDDTVRYAMTCTKQFCDGMVKLESQPKCVSAWDRYIVVGCIDSIVVLENKKLLNVTKVKYQPNSISVHPGGTEVAVGGHEDNKIHIFNFSNGTLNETRTLELYGPANDIKYSPDGSHMAIGTSDKKVHLFKLPEYEPVYEEAHHTARVNAIAWAPDSQYFASGSLDSNIIFWKLKSYSGKLTIRGAHAKNQITGLAWIDGHRLVSTGQDSCVKQWTVNFS